MSRPLVALHPAGWDRPGTPRPVDESCETRWLMGVDRDRGDLDLRAGLRGMAIVAAAAAALALAGWLLALAASLVAS